MGYNILFCLLFTFCETAFDVAALIQEGNLILLKWDS